MDDKDEMATLRQELTIHLKMARQSWSKADDQQRLNTSLYFAVNNLFAIITIQEQRIKALEAKADASA